MTNESSTISEKEVKEYKNLRLCGDYYYGKHVMITAESCNEKLLDIDTMKQFLITLADEIDMIRHGEPIVERFGDGCQVGLSGVQLITTSALTIHTNDQWRDLYLDVFSCKWYDNEIVEAVVKRFFAPEKMNMSEVLRK